MKRIILTVLFIVFCITQAYADKVASPIPIGIGVAIKGDMAIYGEEQMIGANIAEKYCNDRGGINGTPVKIVSHDTGANEAGAVFAFRHLLEKNKVVAIVGPTLSQQCFSACPVANRKKVPVLAPSDTVSGIPQIGEYIGRVSSPNTLVIPPAMTHALKMNPQIKKIAILYARDNALHVSESEVFLKTAKSLNLHITAIEKFETTDTDFTAQVKAVLKAQVDLVTVSGFTIDGGTLVRQLRRNGYKGMIAGGNGFNSPNLFTVCGKDCHNIIVAQAYSPAAKNPVNEAFVKLYREQMKKDPSQFAAQSFAAIQVIVEGLRKVEQATGEKITRMEIDPVRQELNKTIRSGSYMTPLGEITLDEEGEIHQKTFYVLQIKMDADGKSGHFVNQEQ
jgi:branched-chain amino acid transport system substrate-binding protein